MIMQGISAVLLNPSAVMWVFVGTLVGILFGWYPRTDRHHGHRHVPAHDLWHGGHRGPRPP